MSHCMHKKCLSLRDKINPQPRWYKRRSFHIRSESNGSHDPWRLLTHRSAVTGLKRWFIKTSIILIMILGWFYLCSPERWDNMKRDFLEKKKISPKPPQIRFSVWSSFSMTPPHAHLSSCNSPLRTRALQSAPVINLIPERCSSHCQRFISRMVQQDQRRRNRDWALLLAFSKKDLKPELFANHCTTWSTDSDFKSHELHHFSFIAQLQHKDKTKEKNNCSFMLMYATKPFITDTKEIVERELDSPHLKIIIKQVDTSQFAARSSQAPPLNHKHAKHSLWKFLILLFSTREPHTPAKLCVYGPNASWKKKQ